jgi:hypothetical protein
MAAGSIKNLSRTGTGIDDIRRWVLENIPPSDEMNAFVMNIPAPILNLISRGSLAFGAITGPGP